MFASAKSLRTLACQRSAFNTRRRQLSAYAWFQIKGPIRARDAVYGARLKVMGSPFSRRWAHLVGELAARASIDQILGVDEY
jgi:hypothetical protein|nr:hypothetical protein [Cupriavidus sp. SHE]